MRDPREGPAARPVAPRERDFRRCAGARPGGARGVPRPGVRDGGAATSGARSRPCSLPTRHRIASSTPRPRPRLARPSHGELVEGQTLGPIACSERSGTGAWPRCTWPATSGITARWRSRCSIPAWPSRSGPSVSCARSRSPPTSAIPHILPLHDSGEAAGLLYYVMPYVEGESLRDRLDARDPAPRGRRAPDRARGGRCAGLCPRAGRDPPGHQAREHPAQWRARAGRRFRDRPGSGPGG